ncbi:ER membrane protein SH3-domain-containing protein [Auriculariales sp. MPI-PUGE-AT-0066]|nr:ER membrane protein SH3-domain-containing protein [Auriculariales sp. MPI-PUGE-AT-0066]
MSLRPALIVSTISFMLGALFTHWMADSLTLWKSPLTDSSVRAAVSYYAILTGPHSFPLPMLGFLWAVIGLGAAALAASAWRGEAFNVMFDGASIFLFLMGAYVYFNDVLPDLWFLASHHSVLKGSKDVPTILVKPTVDIASRHLVCCVLLTGIIVLQAARLWAENEQDAEDAEIASQAAVEEAEKLRHSPETAPRRYHDAQTDDEVPELQTNGNATGSIRKKPAASRRAASNTPRKTSDR